MLTVRPDKPLESAIAAVLTQVGAVAEGAGLAYFLIGARAIDVLLHNVYGLRTNRPTLDTDFAIAVESWRRFEEFKAKLTGTGEFSPVAGRVHQLLYQGSFPVDLVPFGELESPKGRIAWPPDGSQVMRVTGFAEISAAAQVVDLGTGIVRIAPLPGLLMLKLFAWRDRGESKDAQDVAALLQGYEYVLEPERLYSDPGLLTAFEYNMQLVGAALLGRNLTAIISGETQKSLAELLAGAACRERLISQLSLFLSGAEHEKAMSAAEKLFAAFLHGLGLREVL
jgi:predicted nucleotidyltransferase